MRLGQACLAGKGGAECCRVSLVLNCQCGCWFPHWARSLWLRCGLHGLAVPITVTVIVTTKCACTHCVISTSPGSDSQFVHSHNAQVTHAAAELPATLLLSCHCHSQMHRVTKCGNGLSSIQPLADFPPLHVFHYAGMCCRMCRRA